MIAQPRRTETTTRGELFDVQVRRFGKFTRFNTQGLRVEDAVALGTRIADTTAAASFRITPAGTSQVVTGTARQQIEGFVQKDRYRQSKRDSNVFVEKNKYRINSPGEKTEISPKGPFTTTKKKRMEASLWA
jgi:hypothetical protein